MKAFKNESFWKDVKLECWDTFQTEWKHVHLTEFTVKIMVFVSLSG